MTRTQMVSDLPRIWRFVADSMGGLAMTSDMKTLGLQVDGVLVAGVLYEGINAHNCFMHVAVVDGVTLPRWFIRYAFEYPFVEIGCRRVSGWVNASNQRARQFDERLGFEREATLNGAAADGGDVLLYVMWRERCRWIGARPAVASMAACALA